MPRNPKIPVPPVKPNCPPPYQPVTVDTDVKIKAVAASIKKQLEAELKSIESIEYYETDTGIHLKINIVNGEPTEFDIPEGPKGDVGPQGPQGEPFTYEDLTPEQKEDLVGPLHAIVRGNDIVIDAGEITLN